MKIEHHDSEGPLHRLPASTKLATALGIVVTVAVLPRAHAPWLAAVAAALASLAALSRVPPRQLALRLLRVELVAVSIAAMALFQPGGLAIAGILLARSTLCLLAMVLLSATTPFPEIIEVLRRAHVPRLLISTLSLMVRYLHVLTDEARRMRRARLSRTFGRSRTATWRALASVVGLLFVRASERAERVYNAMCARGGGQ